MKRQHFAFLKLPLELLADLAENDSMLSRVAAATRQHWRATQQASTARGKRQPLLYSALSSSVENDFYGLRDGQ